jgi:hypothetical protein
MSDRDSMNRRDAIPVCGDVIRHPKDGLIRVILGSVRVAPSATYQLCCVAGAMTDDAV